MPARKMPKAVALTKKIIQLNGPRRRAYMTFDIDRPLGALAWEDANLPIPNMIISNPENGHAHLVYEIADPVWFPRKDDDRPDAPPVRYWKAIQKAMQTSLGGDSGYTGLLAKNPLHPSWRTSYGSTRPYRLGELAQHVDLTRTHADKPKIRDAGGRRATLFDTIRYWAYHHKGGFANLEDFRIAIEDELDLINNQFDKGPEKYSDIRSIAKSVSRWLWLHDIDCKNRGIMGLDSAIPLDERQRLGQAYTCRLRVNKTLEKIRSAIALLRQGGGRLTKTAIAKTAKIHRNTVSRQLANTNIAFTFDIDVLYSSTATSYSSYRETECLRHESFKSGSGRLPDPLNCSHSNQEHRCQPVRTATVCTPHAKKPEMNTPLGYLQAG
jgi:hypothetical protein